MGNKIVVYFNPDTNQPLLMVDTAHDITAMGEAYTNPPGAAVLILDGDLYAAPDVPTLIGTLDQMNPNAKALRELATSDALALKVAADAGTFAAALTDATSQVDIIATDPKAPPADAATLQGLRDAAASALADLNFALSNVAKGVAADTPSRAQDAKP